MVEFNAHLLSDYKHGGPLRETPIGQEVQTPGTFRKLADPLTQTRPAALIMLSVQQGLPQGTLRLIFWNLKSSR